MADHTLQSTIEIAGSLSPSLQSAINAAVSRLEEMSKETLEAAGASAQLAAKISTQETVLKNLEQGYADYIVTGQEGTEEAEQLASTIQELSGELTENRGTLDADALAMVEDLHIGGIMYRPNQAEKLKRCALQSPNRRTPSNS